MVLIQQGDNMKVTYRTCHKCKYSLNPTAEKLCLYCREKMPTYDNSAVLLFKKGYIPKTFYGKINKMFTKVYTSPKWEVNYVYGSYRKSAEINITNYSYLSPLFFEKVTQCGGHVYSLSTTGNNTILKLRQDNKLR